MPAPPIRMRMSPTRRTVYSARVLLPVLIALAASPDAGYDLVRDVIEGGRIELLDRDVYSFDDPSNPDRTHVSTLTGSQLRLLRDTWFARRGLRFKSADLTAHFSRFPWYRPKKDNVDAMLTEQDRANIEAVTRIEAIRHGRERFEWKGNTFEAEYWTYIDADAAKEIEKRLTGATFTQDLASDTWWIRFEAPPVVKLCTSDCPQGDRWAKARIARWGLRQDPASDAWVFELEDFYGAKAVEYGSVAFTRDLKRSDRSFFALGRGGEKPSDLLMFGSAR